MDTLPVVVHSATQHRVDTTNVARFETMLDAADAAVAAATKWRARAAQATQAPDTAEGNLRVVLAAICATCDGGAAPDADASQRDLLKWTVESITNARDTAVRNAAGPGLVRGIAPEKVGTCLELISRLNQAMGGTDPAALTRHC